MTTHTPTPWQVHIPRRDIRSMFGGDTGIEILQPLTDPESGQCGGYQIVIGHVNCQHEKRILTKADAEFICRAVNSHDELLDALKALFEHCAMVHKHWGEGSNQKQADEAIAAAIAAIQKAEGE